MDTEPTDQTTQANSGMGTDWERIARMTDADIERAVAADPDAAPIRSREEIMTRFRLVPPRIKR